MLSKKLRGLIVVLTLSVLAIGLAPAQEMTSGGATVPTLKQQLQFGLLARTPHEREFIDEVVEIGRQRRPTPKPGKQHFFMGPPQTALSLCHTLSRHCACVPNLRA